MRLHYYDEKHLLALVLAHVINTNLVDNFPCAPKESHNVVVVAWGYYVERMIAAGLFPVWSVGFIDIGDNCKRCHDNVPSIVLTSAPVDLLHTL